jgi:hypothetical protein
MMAVIISLQVLVFLALLATLGSEMVTRHQAFERWRRLFGRLGKLGKARLAR